MALSKKMDEMVRQFWQTALGDKATDARLATRGAAVNKNGKQGYRRRADNKFIPTDAQGNVVKTQSQNVAAAAGIPGLAGKTLMVRGSQRYIDPKDGRAPIPVDAQGRATLAARMAAKNRRRR